MSNVIRLKSSHVQYVNRQCLPLSQNKILVVSILRDINEMIK